MSGRSLQRRLHGEATSFAAVLDEVRRVRAFERLADPALSVAEVAFLLGYAEPAAFNHAFKRWTSQTPQQWRATRSA
jgi:AraC-like DNA-binding protein